MRNEAKPTALTIEMALCSSMQLQKDITFYIENNRINYHSTDYFNYARLTNEVVAKITTKEVESLIEEFELDYNKKDAISEAAKFLLEDLF